MFRRILCLFFTFASASLFAYPETTFFPINSMQRGNDIVNLINTVLPPYFPTFPQQYEIAIQTTNLQYPGYYPYNYINNGLIPFVQSVEAAPNGTVLIITFNPNGNTSVNPAYIVVPIEYVVGVVFSTSQFQSFPSNTNFLLTSPFPSATLPLLQIDLKNRALDIQSVVNTLLTQSKYNLSGTRYVAIQAAAFFPTYVKNSYGYVLGNYTQPQLGTTITYVKSVAPVTPNDTIVVINYQPNTIQTIIPVVMSVEQIQQIIYFPHQ